MTTRVFLLLTCLMMILSASAHAQSANMAIGARVDASDTRKGLFGSGGASALVDGKPRSAWTSGPSKPVHIALDLGKTVEAKTIRLLWAKKAASSYIIRASTDGMAWPVIAERSETGRGPRTDDITVQSSFRYLGIELTESVTGGFALYEIEVLSTVPPAVSKSVPPPEQTPLSNDGAELDELRQQLDASQTQNKMLSQSAESLLAQIKNLKEEKKALSEELTGTRAASDERKLGNAEHLKETDTLKTRISSLEQDLLKAEAQKVALQDQVKTLKLKNKEASDKLAQADTTPFTGKKETALLRRRIKELEETLDASDARHREMAEKLRKAEITSPRVAQADTSVPVDKRELKLRERVRQLEKDLQNSESGRKTLDKELRTLDDVKKARETAELDRRAAEERLDGIKSKVRKERLDIHYNMAVVYQKNAMYNHAEDEYLKCLEMDQDDSSVHYNLGILYDDKLNNNAMAMKHYQRFLDLRPDSRDALQVREWMLNAEQEKRLGLQAK